MTTASYGAVELPCRRARAYGKGGFGTTLDRLTDTRLAVHHDGTSGRG